MEKKIYCGAAKSKRRAQKRQIEWLLIDAIVLLYGVVGEPLESETADEITEILKEVMGKI